MRPRRTAGVLALSCLGLGATFAAPSEGRTHATVVTNVTTVAAASPVQVGPSFAPPAVAKPSARPRALHLARRLPRSLTLVNPAVPHGGLALTFDDGPDPRWTPKVLAILAAAHVHATFCMIGREALRHPDLVRAVVTGGHTLCDHTFDHDELLCTKSASTIHANVFRAYVAITAASGGVAPVFFRAPGGEWSPRLLAEVRAEGLTPLGWTVDPRDWSRPGISSIRLTALAQANRGGIVLLHDGGGDRSQTLEALTVLLRMLPRRGYTFEVPSALR